MTEDTVTQIVGIEGWRVQKSDPWFEEKEGERPRLTMEIVRIKADYRCPCGRRLDRHYDGEERMVRDLPLGFRDLWLVFFQARVECPVCGVKTEALEWLDSMQRCTKRFAAHVATLCRLMPVAAVADYLGMDWKTVKRYDKQTLEKELNPPDLDGLRLLAVDEIAIRKGYRFATVVLDYETRRVVWAEQGRSEESLAKFYNLLGKERCAQIEAVAMDMWQPYINATGRHCPNAKIVYDPFHILANFSKVINKVRNQEFKRASETNKEVIRGTKFMLLKNKKNLRVDEKQRLEELLRLNKPISTMYILKEDLKRLWKYRYPGAAKRFFAQWYRTAIYSKIEPLKQFARQLKDYWDGIVVHCRYPIHTSVLEGIHNKAKVIKRLSYGFHDMQYFFLKLRAASPGKPDG